MFQFMQNLRGHRYSKLADSKESLPGPPLKSSIRQILLSILGVLIVGGAGYALGRHSAVQESGAPHLDTVSQVFKYNRTFGDVPSNYTNQAWEDLFPLQGGFFKHPDLAPERSAFSVFHQLHCLNGIREGYWGAFQAATEGRKLLEEDIPTMSSPPHIRHCIDLLRNALMCQPDLTIEVRDDEIGGVKGFGTEHMCKNWNQLMQFTSQWQWWHYEPQHHKPQDHAHSRGAHQSTSGVQPSALPA